MRLDNNDAVHGGTVTSSQMELARDYKERFRTWREAQQ
jgi:hypothetical protein